MASTVQQYYSLNSSRVNPLVVILLLTVLYLARTRYRNGLNKIPGPFLASISSFWKFNVVRCEQMPFISNLLHEKFGPLVRIGPNHVSASSAEAIQLIHRGKGFTKTPMYGILQPLFEGADLHNIFSTQDPEYHAALKRTIGNLYTTTAVTELEHHMDDCTLLFLSKMNDIVDSNTPATVDMGSWLQFWAFDTLGEINFSRKLGFLDAGVDLDGICEFDHQQMMYFSLMGQIPTLEKVWSKLKSIMEEKKENPLFEFSLGIVRDRLENPREAKDMLNSFLKLHKASPERFTFRDVLAATYINVVTAHDVLAITLRAIVYYLSKDPVSQKRLQSEISQRASSSGISNPSKYSEIQTMTYLSAVIHEALRIHPSTGLIFERSVPKGGITLHGKHIPEKTVIGVNSWVINREKSIFGDDADVFRPERWIESDPDAIQNMKRNLFTFGAGSRNCIGRNMAMMQIMKIIVELYRHFDTKLVHTDKEWHVSGGWLTRQSGLEVILERNRS